MFLPVPWVPKLWTVRAIRLRGWRLAGRSLPLPCFAQRSALTINPTRTLSARTPAVRQSFLSPQGRGSHGISDVPERPELEHHQVRSPRKSRTPDGMQARTPAGDRRLPGGSGGTTQTISPGPYGREEKPSAQATPDPAEI